MTACVEMFPDLIGQGRYSKSYYSATENKEEELLKDAIQTLTGNGYVSLGYNTARDKMFMIIDNQAVNGQGASQNTLWKYLYRTAGSRICRQNRLSEPL